MEKQKPSGYVEDKLAALAPSLDRSTVGIDDDLFLKMAEEFPNFSETMGKT